LNKIKIYGVSIAICLVFVSLLINSFHAQSLENFETYTNKEMKFTIQHPSNWEPREQEPRTKMNPEDLGGVWFGMRERGEPYFSVNPEKVKPYLDTDTMTIQNTSVQQYAEQRLQGKASVGRVLESSHYSLIRQNGVTVGGNPAWKVEYKIFGKYAFDIYTDADGIFYTLTYNEDPLKVPETLPLAIKMVESFQIIR
jgi:hypothetical protein